jgi:hypothetical protein
MSPKRSARDWLVSKAGPSQSKLTNRSPNIRSWFQIGGGEGNLPPPFLSSSKACPVERLLSANADIRLGLCSIRQAGPILVAGSMSSSLWVPVSQPATPRWESTNDQRFGLRCKMIRRGSATVRIVAFSGLPHREHRYGELSCNGDLHPSLSEPLGEEGAPGR